MRASALGDASRLMAELVSARPADALLRQEPQGRRARSTASRPTGVDRELAARLSPYRAGYTPAQRREIERRLVEGELLGVAATDALELGIDVGLLDAVDLGRLPGHGRVAAPAVGPRRPPRARARGAGRERGRARPVLHARAARRCSAAASRRRSSTTRTRASSTATSARPRSRRRSTTPTARSSATRHSSARPMLPELKQTPRGYVWAGRDYPAARVPLRSTTPGRVHDRRRRQRLGARAGRARARVLDRPRGRDLPAPGRAVPRASSSTSRPAPRSSSRSRATGTRRRRRRRRPQIDEALRRSGGSGSSFVRRGLGHRAGGRATRGSRSATGERSTSSPLDLPETTFETEAVWYLPEPRAARRTRRRCRGCSARSTRPSTR